MSDRIDFGGEPWQAIPRRILRDPRLSHRAKGGLVTLLSHEEGWVRSAIAVLMHEGRCGRKQAQAIMAELRAVGYAELVKEHKANLIKSRYVIYAIPKGATFQPQLVNSSDLPVSGPSPFGSTGKGAAVVDPRDVDPQDVEPQDQTLALAARTRPRDELFEALAEVEGADLGSLTRSARGKLNSAAKQLRDIGATADDVRARAATYRRVHPTWELTSTSLVSWWPSLKRVGSVTTPDQGLDDSWLFEGATDG